MSENRRLHPSTLVFSFGRAIRVLILPAVVALFSGAESAWGAILLAVFVISSVVAVARYITLTWRLDATELVVREGIFFKSERHVPYARIQNVDLVQSLFHRVFQVAEVRLETASGTEPEAVLRVLGLDDASVLRDKPFRERRGAPLTPEGSDAGAVAEMPSVDDGEVLVRVPLGHLVLLGLVMNRGLAVVGAGFALLHEFDAFQALVERIGMDTWFQSLFDAGLLAVLVVLALMGLIVVGGLSIVWSVIRFWSFTLRAEGNDFRLACGLLTRISASIPRQRIQSLTISESWIHRCFGLASIRAQTAGGSSADESSNLARSRFVPVLPAEEAPRIVTAALPHIHMGALDWQPISPKAVGRIRRRGILLIAIPAAPLAIFVSPWTLVGAGVLTVLVWWWAGAAVARSRFARTAWGLVWQRGVIARETTFLPEEKVQTVRLVASPFDRRHRHVTLLVDAAGGGRASPEVRIRYLDRAVAEALFGELAVAAATTEYQVREVQATAAASGGHDPRRHGARRAGA